ncbi:MAG: phosphoethanolamine transferase domain-containing protein, partial [Granulosicoccaceae bacterium]
MSALTPVRSWQLLPSTWQLHAIYAPFLLVMFVMLVDNLSFWGAFSNALQPSSWLAPVALALFLFALFSAILQLANLPRLFKPIAFAILLLAAGTSYFMDNFGVVVHDSMIRNLLQTDSREVADLLTAGFLLHLLLYGLLPAIILFKINFRYQPAQREIGLRLLVMVSSLLLAGGAVAAEYKDLSLMLRQHRELRMLLNPVYPIYATMKYLHNSNPEKPQRLKSIADDAVHGRTAGPSRAGGRVVILVLGETARAAEFSLNGYTRQTNPELEQLDVINYSNVTSCGTATAESVPCIFSHLPRSDYSPEKAGEYENVLDILHKSGV